MKYSVSIHNGNKSNRGHNTRSKESIYNQKHIDRDGEIIILKDESIQTAYEKLFGEAVREYNEKQKRKDRKIKNYLNKITANKEAKSSANPIYEVIVQIGNMDNQIDEETNINILKDYFTQWEERNPNLYLTGAVIHMDEATIHMHCSYIPCAHYEKGLSVRNGLNKALNEMGFEDDTFSNTPIMRWQTREQQAVMEICKSYGIDTENKKTAKREHYTTEEYKLYKKIKELDLQYTALKEKTEALKEQAKITGTIYQNLTANAQYTINGINNKLQEIDKTINNTEKTRELLKGIKEAREELREELGEFSKQLKPKENKKEDYSLDL